MTNCLFCQIAAKKIPAQMVYEDDRVMAFLDIGPVFHGHTLVAPKAHTDTLLDLPDDLSAPLLAAVKLIGRAIEEGLGAEGSFIAVNNRVSQTVPHLHVHVMPRTRGDGMKGFFWPRRPYRDEEQREQVRAALAKAVDALLGR